jgi:hypothetical protein
MVQVENEYGSYVLVTIITCHILIWNWKSYFKSFQTAILQVKKESVSYVLEVFFIILYQILSYFWLKVEKSCHKSFQIIMVQVENEYGSYVMVVLCD